MVSWSLAAGGVAAQTSASAQSPNAQSSEIETVTVTASRRETTVRETPTAVSAYSGKQLAADHVVTLTDLVASSPDVQIGIYSTNADITIRGIGNPQTVAGSDPGVAFNYDGVYLAQSGLTISSMLDVSRVEILRGPQGTLFGRNATGGAVNVIPNLPTEQFAAGIDTSVGFGPTQDHSTAFVSGPLTSDGQWLARLAVQQTYNDGYTRNLAPDGPSRFDGQNNYSGRGQLEWLPTGDLTVRLSLDYQKEDDSGAALFLLGDVPPGAPLPVQIQGAPSGNIDKRETYSNVGVNNLKAAGATLTTDWVLDGGDLKAVVAVDSYDQFTSQNGSGTGVDFTHTEYLQRSNQYYAEVLYSSDPSHPFTYVVGANYFHENEFQQITVPIRYLAIPVILGGTLGTSSYAAYVHGQYEIEPGLKVFAGLRYTSDHKAADEFNDFVGTLDHQKGWNHITYEAGASYDFSDAVTGFLKYSTGYRSGGFSIGSLQGPFSPEENTSVEADLKGSYLNGRLQANLAAFHMSYSNMQVNQVNGVSEAVTNAASSTIDGFEAEFVGRVSDELRLELSGDWLDAHFDVFNTEDSARPGLGILNLAGHLLPQAPKFSLSGAAYYDVPISVPGTVTLSARYDWKSRLFFDPFNLPVSSQGPAGKLDLSINYASEDDRWTASVFALNATDAVIKNHVIVVSALLGSLALGGLDPGREIGISAGYHF
ncbi:MAG: TonB-dependent receptor [Rhizomicrobium sp.]